MADTDELYYLKDDEIEMLSDDLDTYNPEVFEGDDYEDDASSGDEDLDTLQKRISMAKKMETSSIHRMSLSSPVKEQMTQTQSVSIGEVIEDFVRNFLVRMGLSQTLHHFQTEWYELLVKGKLSEQHQQSVPDVYTQNQMLLEQVGSLKEELNGFKEAARIAKEKYVRLKKERDFHRMHHRRTMQEKDKLVTEIKRLKEHFASYEPVLNSLKTKYESATRDKMLTKLERDKAMSELECLHSTLYSLRPSSQAPPTNEKKPLNNDRSRPLPPIATKQQQNGVPNKLHSLPHDMANPYLTNDQPLCAHLSRVGGFQLTGTINAHEYPISCLSLHPTKNILATGSDDHNWRVWSVPNGDLLMTGEGHEAWVSGIEFHQEGNLLATCGGDGVIKIWNFTKLSSIITLEEHRQPVWDCSWHWNSNLIASCGMDHTLRIWDPESIKCLLTLRGHSDSVNGVHFLPYTNTMVSCSADKTVSIWDIRMGLCVHTMTAHKHSCNTVVSNWQSSQFFSADCFGAVMCWDVRTVGNEPLNKWDIGAHPVNGMSIDKSGSVLACGSGSGKVFMIQLNGEEGPERISKLSSQDNESVEDVVYGHNSDVMYSVGANGLISQWQ